MSIECADPRFTALVSSDSAVERLWTGARWAEGPVYFGDSQMLLFSDIPNNRKLRWVPDGGGAGQVTEFTRQANFSNGHTRDHQGRLLACEHGTRRVVRFGRDGVSQVLATHWGVHRLNSPNDVVVARDGSIWFTDPTYGILSDVEGFKAEPEYGGAYVFRIDPRSGALQVIADDFVQPNGLAFSPDESRLYVADSGGSHLPQGPHHIRVFDLQADGTWRGGEVFAVVSPGVPDGMRVDTLGNLWTSAADGIHCYAPEGALLGKILVPEVVANLCFGGPEGRTLFITATTSLYRCEVLVGCAAG